ncbi:MAG: hypothetical protein ACRC6K_06670 [Fusobacteriaceae bacterium]
MKKLLILLLLLVSTLSFGIDTHLRLGLIGNSKNYGTEKKLEDYQPTIGLEVTQTLLFFDIGGGIQYNRKTDGVGVSTVPVYLLAKWNIIPIFIKPYIVGKVGKSIYSSENLNNSDVEAGYYYGAGIGMDISFLQAELLYSITELKDDRRNYDDIKQLSLILGYRL